MTDSVKENTFADEFPDLYIYTFFFYTCNLIIVFSDSHFHEIKIILKSINMYFITNYSVGIYV